MGLLDEIKGEIPTTTQVTAILLLLINIFLPGWGTFIMAFIGGFKVKTLVVAIIQFLTCWLLIGWIWSIWWGILCLQKSSG